MSRRDHVIATLRKELPGLRERFGVSSLALFGSVARADDRPSSDVDLLVEFERPATLVTISELKHELSQILGCPVDVGTARSLRPNLRERVIQESIRVA